MFRSNIYHLHGVLLLSLLFSFTNLQAADCHPPIDPEKPQYMIGYGSLMNKSSKLSTEPNAGESRPVSLTGFQRSWNTHGVYPTTFLGSQPSESATMVAALYRDYPGEDGKLASDAREIDYCRAAVKPETVTMLDGSESLASVEVWIYVNKPETLKLPDAGHPIVQSYVDIFITGCLQLQELVTDPDLDFVEQCILTTDGWSKSWVNDRLYPRRPYHYEPKAFQIDKYLQRLLPEYVDAVKIE